MDRKTRRPKETGWNEVAEWYDGLVGDEGSDYHRNVIIPGALRMLAPQKGEKVLDVACGQGVFSRKLAEAGAEVVGIDASKRLIDSAKKRSPDIKYAVVNAASMKLFQDGTFDSAASIMALQNIDPIAPVLSEISRVLKPGGRFLFVTLHPCFRVPRNSHWGFDHKKDTQYRRVDRYMSQIKVPIRMHPGYAPDQITYTYHRPLSEYFKVLRSCGLAVIDLEEWISHRISKSGPRKKAEDSSRIEIPMFVSILARKP
ncbi:MAG TPA: class I SAM-dependent methyltransferase [Candidatus Omnitrophota bacterium]|nr:class I SAM-dependent methyltransferase [Candidatus Omnitrophota bacterium]